MGKNNKPKDYKGATMVEKSWQFPLAEKCGKYSKI